MNNSDWFNDIAEKVYINAIYKNGQFFDVKTNKLISLKNNTKVRISIPIWAINEGERKRHQEKIRNILLKKGVELRFRFNYQDKRYEFKVNLIENLYYTRKGKQFSKLEPCKCIVTLIGTSEKIIADSLNQAFVKISVKYRPQNKTHTCNVFKTFYYKGRKLENLREL